MRYAATENSRSLHGHPVKTVPTDPSWFARNSRNALTCRILQVGLLLLLLASGGRARADEVQRKFSPYEQETIELVLADVGGTIDTAPEGKTIESIEIVTLDVFEPRDPAPAFLNWFHVTTQREIVEREVLLRSGDRYDPLLAAESERNLRSFVQLSVVLIVPISGSSPDRVRLLVVTKDVWSLRLSWAPSFVNGKLTALSLAPAESNLFGTTQTIAASVYLDPINYWIGGRYYVPRIGESRIRASLGGNAIFNCATNEIEGATGDFIYGQPLYSSRARWSWQTAMTWSSSVVRGLSTREDVAVCGGGRPSLRRYRTSPQEVTGESPNRVLEEDEIAFPSEYRSERLRGQAVFTRSYGGEDKFNLSTGLELDWRTSVREPVPITETIRERVRYEEQPNGSFARASAQELPPDQAQFDAVERVYLDPRALPPRDRRISPYGQLHAYSNSYRRVINYATLGLQEDIQVGHDVYLRLYPAFAPVSSRDLLGVFASAAYTGYYNGGFARALASATIEYAGPRRSDASLRGTLHLATPDVGVGRFVYDFSLRHQPTQYLTGLYELGGTGRLRGYHPGRLYGPGLVTFNHEFRSRPLRLFSVLTGVAVFHDLGSVFDDSFGGFRLRQGVGAGLRILFPQLDRDVFRVDFGFPIVRPGERDPAAEFTFVASFYQAFSAPVAASPALLEQ